MTMMMMPMMMDVTPMHQSQQDNNYLELISTFSLA